MTARMIRSVAMLLALLLVVAACGGGEAIDAAADDTTAAPADTTGAPESTTTAAETTTTVAAEASEIVVDHVQGQTVLDGVPETIVVFDFGAAQTLDELGVEMAAMPESPLPASLSKYADDAYPEVGTLFEPDYEAVNALAPDLIVVALRSGPAYEELSKIAPTIDVTVDSTNFAESFAEQTVNLAAAVGKADEATARLAEIDALAQETAAMAADGGTALIVMTSAGEVTAYGPGSRFGFVHDDLGVTPAVDDVEAATHGDAISFEFILEADPDILYVVDRDVAIGEEAEAAAAVLDNELVHETSAWQNDNIVYVTSSDWYITPSGLASAEQMIREVQAGLG